MNATKILLSLGLILCAWDASAESLYSVSPKIPPRTRESGPVVSPLLSYPEFVSPQRAAIQPQPESQMAHRIDLKSTQEIPVSNTETQPGSQDARLRPATFEPAPVPASRPKKNAHPVVHPVGPESLAEPMDQRAVTESEVLSGQLIADATVARPQTGGVSKTGPASSVSQGKPLVHFPEELAPSPDAAPAVNTTDSSTDKHIYPVGYKAYIPPVNADKRRWLETAISHYNRGGYYQDRNDLDAAIEEYQQAILFNKNFADAYVGLSSVFMRKNDWAKVVETANQALNKERHFMDPANIGQAWFNLSTAYCVGDDYRWAYKYYQKAQLAGHPALEPLRDFMKKNCTP